jgi:hypothetical protein
MNAKLDTPLDNYKVITSISDKAHQLIKQNKKYIAEFNLPILGKKSKNQEKDIDKYFDTLNDTILEYAFLELISTFEAIVIDIIKNASGNMKKTLAVNYTGNDFKNYEDKFIKKENDLGSLNKILDLLKGKIDPNLHEKLAEIIKYRDKLAHGKRFYNDIVLERIEDTRDVMEAILEEITKTAK